MINDSSRGSKAFSAVSVGTIEAEAFVWMLIYIYGTACEYKGRILGVASNRFEGWIRSSVQMTNPVSQSETSVLRSTATRDPCCSNSIGSGTGGTEQKS